IAWHVQFFFGVTSSFHLPEPGKVETNVFLDSSQSCSSHCIDQDKDEVTQNRSEKPAKKKRDLDIVYSLCNTNKVPFLVAIEILQEKLMN
ncbi:MAG TPA: hypothetical protein DEP85_01795, partial [Holosporales bacterium]|nr:hypothetical protein [Holosporales bacterium]